MLALVLGDENLALELLEVIGESSPLLPSHVGFHGADVGLDVVKGDSARAGDGEVDRGLEHGDGALLEGSGASVPGSLEGGDDSSDGWSIEPLLVLEVGGDFFDELGAGVDAGEGIVSTLDGVVGVAGSGGNHGEEE